MRTLLTRLADYRFVRRTVQILRLQHLGNAWLRLRPVVTTLAGSGTKFRAVRLESIPLGVEMLEQQKTYPSATLPREVKTFVDLGCNVGYFACLLSHLMKRRDLKGLMIDANPQAVEEVRWHLAANQLTNVFAAEGVVGECSTGKTAPFYVYDSNICSTSQVPPKIHADLPGKWTQIQVPCLKVGEIWAEKFGRTRCELLKVDIEGSEMNFLRLETSFLKLVDFIVLEWHKWRVDLTEVRSLLESQGFRLIQVLEENDDLGTCLFQRSVAAA